MAMCGYDRVIVEPSGIYDVDEFFDGLREEPLDRWYEIGSVITIVDALSLIHISEPTRRTPISYAVFCLKKKNSNG